MENRKQDLLRNARVFQSWPRRRRCCSAKGQPGVALRSLLQSWLPSPFRYFF